MVGLGVLFIAACGYAWLMRNKLLDSPWLLKFFLYSIPLPYLACQLGWTLTEVGRQPWIVWGIMRTSDAVSPIAVSQVAVSTIAFIVVYSLLGMADFYLLFKFARKGPKPPISKSAPAPAPVGR
jgi:cytochrome d ubiquinol oxidase subunit I